ncbi:MAG: leucyl aminopeptidase family protein [Candidatus Caenarcaniphilales bacterium]|nr:leucyl aminopeptidase family protein [Candidatus Caenarcaniphilales bacterium]
MKYSTANWHIHADSSLEFGKTKVALLDKSLVLLVGTGKAKKLNTFRLRKLAHKAIDFLKQHVPEKSGKVVSHNFKDFTNLSEEELNLLLQEPNYEFDKYKKIKHPKADLSGLTKSKKSSEEFTILNSINLIKDLVNEPPNIATPKFLADTCLALGKKLKNIKVKTKNRAECQKLGLTAFLAVAQGSDLEPYMIEMEYMAVKKNQPTIGLIGKGLTYDTGGLSLKPNKYMYGMKSDMAGAATVIGVMKAIAEMKLPVNVKALILACENGFGDNSYRPGDVVKAYNGKTIEIVDTDAEGRITLADALAYLSEDKSVETIIDFATLTGSCAVTFGDAASGAFTNDKNLLAKYQQAGDKTGEPIWELPMDEEMKEDLKSSIADMSQCAGRPDASLAALLLKEFIQGEQKWLHLDIAGTGYLDEATDYFPCGATGRGVWSTIEFLKNTCK